MKPAVSRRMARCFRMVARWRSHANAKHGPTPVLERRPGEEGDRRVRATTPLTRPARSTCPRRTDRHLRPGRHALGRTAHLHAGDLLPGAGPGCGQTEAGIEGQGAVQDGALPGDREAIAKLPMKDLEEILRHPFFRDERSGFRRRGEEVAGHRQTPALGPAVHRAHLPADAGEVLEKFAPTATRRNIVDRRRPLVRVYRRARCMASPPSRWSAASAASTFCSNPTRR